MNRLIDSYMLNNGTSIPCVGYGTWQMPDDTVGYKAVRAALDAGYRHIDTAAVYGNEETVGRAIKDSGIPRKELFVTTKLWNGDHGYERTMAAFKQSLEKLGLDYVDLYLIHWPNPPQFRDDWQSVNTSTWKAMEVLHRTGKARAIGVSNFRIHHLESLLSSVEVVPAVNQIRLCPGDTPVELLDYCTEHEILLEAYSPLGTGKVFDVPELSAIALKHDTTVAKVALRWSLQRGFLPLPKSVTPERILANADLFDLELDEQDMAVIDHLDGVCGYSTDPDTTTW